MADNDITINLYDEQNIVAEVNNIDEESIIVNLVQQPDIVVEMGEQGPQGIQGPAGPRGVRGETGNGIASFELTSSSVLTDTYTITFTDGNTQTISVENGKSVSNIELTSTVGLVDTYTITYNDNTTSTFNITNGRDAIITGAGATISNTVGTPSVNVITNGTPYDRSFTFEFDNLKGEQGEKGDKGDIGPQGVQGEQGPQGPIGPIGHTGNGIQDISLISTVGLQKTYRITYTDGTHYDYIVTDGAAGATTWGGISGVLSNQTDLQNALNGKLSITGTADKALKDSNGLQINTTYMRKTIGDAWIPATPTAPTSLTMVGRQGCGNGNIAGGNLVALHKNTLFRCYERGSTITCNYEDKVANLGKSMCDGSFSGHYTQINPSTSFTSEPFVWEVMSPTQYEVSDVCRLHIYSHRLTDALNVTAFKIEAYIYDTLTHSKKWITAYEYSGASRNIAQTGFGLYKTGYSSNPYYSIFGIRLTISGSPDTIFRMSQVQLVASRGTEKLADSLQCVSNAGGKVWGDLEVTGQITVPTKATGTNNTTVATTAFVNNSIIDKADIDLSNLSTTGQEILNAKANTDLSNITEAGIEVIKSNSGGGLEIGDIGIAPLGIDESLGKRRYLNGSILVQEQYPYFTQRVKTAIQTYAGLGCTEEEWQTISNMSVGGQCGKFVVNDTAGTIRLPKIIMPIQGLTNLTNLGEIIEAGLPNITGQHDTNSTGATGAFTSGDIGAHTLSSWNGSITKTKINASLANSIYGNSDTVQQEQIQYPYFIQVATGSSYQENITNEVELNNPFVLLEGKYFETPVYNVSWLQSNAGFTGSSSLHPTAYNALLVEQNPNVEVGTTVDNYTKRGLSVKLDTETYTDYDFVLNTTSQTFRCPLKINKASGRAVVGNGMALGLTDGSTLGGLTTNTWLQGYSYGLGVMDSAYGEPVGVSDNSTTSRVSKTSLGVTSDPTKSGIETSDSDLYLYFYVGETVQNANLVNVGRIEEKLSNCITRNDCSAYIVETYQNGTSWYRVYSDGWCEQGGAVDNNGRTQIALLKNFIDTNYEVIGSCFTKNSSSNGCWFCYDTKTTSSFYVRFSYDNGSSISTNSHYVYIWEAKGKVF